MTRFESKEEIEPEDKGASLDNLVINEDTRNRVLHEIRKMDRKYRDLLLFRYYFNMKNVDVAKMLNVSVNTVNGQMSRAKAKLAVSLCNKR